MAEEKIEYLPLALIVASIQVRREFSEESLRGLMESLLAVGQLAPIRVRKEGDLYVIVDGDRRFRAMKLAGTFETISVIVEQQDLTPAAVCHRQLVANVQRDSLTPLECSNALHDLMRATGWSVTEIAAQVGMSAANVTKALALTQLPPAIQAEIESGKIPANAGYHLSRVTDATEQAKLAAQVASGELTRDALTGIVKGNGTSKPRTTGKPGRFRAELSVGRSIIVSGSGLDNLETLVSWLEELLRRIRKLRPKGLALARIARQFRDEAQTETQHQTLVGETH